MPAPGGGRGSHAPSGGGPVSHEEEEGIFNGSSRFASYGVIPTTKSANAPTSLYEETSHTLSERFVHHNWPLFLEFVCSYILTVVAFNCRANPPTLGLVYAGLAHMASTSTYYLQANPILTLAQFARGHFDIVKCALNLSAQLLGVILAALTFWFAFGGSLHGTVLPSITTCDAVPWSGALLTESVYTGAFIYIALSAWDSMALELQSTCSHYGLCVGTAFYASVRGIQCRGMGSALLNPWIGLLGLFTELVQYPNVVTSCQGVHVLGPFLGGCIGALLSWLTSLNGSEKEAILRSMAPLAPLALEMTGVAILVLSLGISNTEPVGAYLVALTLIAWRRSGAQYSPSLTLTIFLFKRQVYQWSSVLWFTAAHVLGAFIGVLLLVSLPISRQALPPLDEQLTVSLMDFILVFLYSVTWGIIFMSATEAEFDEGFLHPPLLAALSLTGLVQAYSSDPVPSALYNPAITLVLGLTLRDFKRTLIILVAQLLASPVAAGFWWLKQRFEI